MPITEVTAARGTNNNGSVTSLSVVMGASTAATAGQLIVVAAGIGDGTANVTKPSGYTDLFTPMQITGTGQSIFCMAKIATGGETGAAWSHSGSASTMNLAIFLFDGALSPLGIDKAATNGTDFAQHITWPTGTTAATTQADEIAIGVAVLNGAATSPGVSGGTLIANVGSNELLVATNVLATTGTQAMTFSWTNPNFVIAGIATIKAAPVNSDPEVFWF